MYGVGPGGPDSIRSTVVAGGGCPDYSQCLWFGSQVPNRTKPLTVHLGCELGTAGPDAEQFM